MLTQDKPRLVLIGGGGHCRSCLDVIEAEGRYQVVAVLDLANKVGGEVLGHRITGTEADIPELAAQGCEFLITVGQLPRPDRRMALCRTIEEAGGSLATVISPLAHVSPLATVGAGTIVMHYAMVNAGAEVGRNCILNSRCLIEHDVRLGDHSHVSTGAILNGGVQAQEGAFVGSGAVVREGLTLGRNSVVGMDAAVFHSLEDGQWLRLDQPGPRAKGEVEVYEAPDFPDYDALPEEAKAPGLHPWYIASDALRDDSLKPLFFLYREGKRCWYHGFHFQAIPDQPYNDIQTAYGYGGPAANTKDPGFLSRAHAAWDQWCREQNVLVEFTRFHPLIDNWRYYGGETMLDRETVWIDLSAEDLLAGYETRARTAVRKALKNGITFRWATDQEGNERFRDIYLEDMARIGAKEMYFFSHDYFQALFDWDATRVGLCERDGELVAAGLFLANGHILEYHLSASTLEGRRLGAVNLLLHEAALHGKAAGLRALHLGGGTLPGSDNPLMFFKAGFSRLRAEFRIGLQIHLPEPYEALKQEWEAKHGAKADKVLFYRF